ncbi:FkbO/Hyg5 family chorismatase [Amycolatopsis sp. WQ 127309]|uniref:FkbO/Hyg5 family chorismatase n=1 Tax=Amycolatopsis sp. WQ 127309 TaxID=2932773 RepID=UPI001FF2CE69|nr:FkbO/Hyg5 family chorismatase [Amycolatopsis sp. WQ 127309]UOZ06993.1 FkbO/Hyg5 family chorismatase [Amycolatopsis sp. WQ 127309]
MSAETASTYALPVLTPAFGVASASTVLGAIRYAGRHREPHDDAGYPELTVQLVRDDADAFTEVWHTSGEVERGSRDGVVYAHDGEHFFAAGHVREARGYTDAIATAYLTALDLARSHGYHRMFRVWNYLHRINGRNAEGLEIYRDFCLGRAIAFDRAGLGAGDLPAATGVGSLGGGIAFCFLATRSGHSLNIENTRQVPAYRYPRRYGPRPPGFARATWLSDSGHIYVSGTASIVGHRTVHPGRVDRQCREALANIAHVIGAENLAAHGLTDGRTPRDLRNVKVYVREHADLAQVREICAEALAPDCAVAYFTTDICRSDLLVEIEGIAMTPA